MERLFQVLAVILAGVAAFFLWQGNKDATFISAVFGAVCFFISVRFQVKERLRIREEQRIEEQRLEEEQDLEEQQRQEELEQEAGEQDKRQG